MTTNLSVTKFDKMRKDLYPRIYRFALRLTRNEDAALDIVQETFIRAYKNNSSMQTDKDPLAWFFRIAYNIFLDQLRTKSRRPTQVPFEYVSPDGSEPDFMDTKANPEQKLLETQLDPKLESALKSLTPEQQELIQLAIVQEISHAELAEMYTCSVPSVRSRLHRALTALRNQFGAKARGMGHYNFSGEMTA